MTAKILSVSELTGAIQSLLEPNFRNLSVRGEVSNLKMQSSGHIYFSLKDASSQISAVLFRSSASRLSRMIKEGDQIIAKGEISIYAPRGTYQIIVRELEYAGVGELLYKLHQLKEQLQKRGWFDAENKKPLPKLPRRIGVVTSPTGAVIQDILNVLTRRFANVPVILNPVKVQGDGAAQEIAQAIRDMNRYQLADVLIVGRGGGSIEDLWAFNEEIVAAAIFESKIPIISAVGHETDFTIADWVADVRAPTPSAAAEMVIAEKAHLTQFLENAREQNKFFFSRQILQLRQRLETIFMHPTLSQPRSLFTQTTMRLDDARESLDSSIGISLQNRRSKWLSLFQQMELLRPSTQIKHFREQLSSLRHRLDDAMISTLSLKKKSFTPHILWSRIFNPIQQNILAKRDLLTQMKTTYSSLHPKNLLNKGYSILFSENTHSIILSSKDIRPNQTFKAKIADGIIHAVAIQIEENDGSQL